MTLGESLWTAVAIMTGIGSEAAGLFGGGSPGGVGHLWRPSPDQGPQRLCFPVISVQAKHFTSGTSVSSTACLSGLAGENEGQHRECSDQGQHETLEGS